MRKAIGGIAGWLMGRLARGVQRKPRLELLERLLLAPKQSLSLIAADGQRILVATSADGSPAFCRLGSEIGDGVRIPLLGQVPMTGKKS